jgi:ankyrin repeat protein
LIETKGCDVNARDKYNITPIHDAFESFELDKGGDANILIYLLLQDGIDVNITDEFGCTVLHSACKKVNVLPLDTFKYLIDIRGGNINLQDDDNDSPIRYAFSHFDSNKGGDINILMYLINLKNIDVNIRGYIGHTLLHLACSNVNRMPLEIFKCLIETKGCDLNLQDECQDTPLHIAFNSFNAEEGGDANILIYLLNRKDFDFNIQDCNGDTFLFFSFSCIKSLPFDVFKCLIGIKGVNVGDFDRYGRTSLHFLLATCIPAQLDSDLFPIAEYLIKKGIDINHKDISSKTVLDDIYKHSSTFPLIFELLIKNGAKLAKNC